MMATSYTVGFEAIPVQNRVMISGITAPNACLGDRRGPAVQREAAIAFEDEQAAYPRAVEIVLIAHRTPDPCRA